MLTTSELKDRIRNLIAECEIYSTTWDIGDRLRALLADIDAEPPKPTGEKVEHYSCIGCGCFPAYPGPVCESCFDRTTNPILRRNYTPKEPEPAAKLEHHNFSSRPCSTCGWMRDGRCGCTVECHGDQWKARDTEAAPGLVCTIEEVVEVIKLICNTNGINAESAVSTALKHMKELHEAVTMLSAQP